MHLLLLGLLVTGRWAAIVLPSDGADDELSQNLTDVLVARLADRTHAELIGKEELRTQLGLSSDRGVLGCVADTPCLGRVGVQLGVDKMVVGTVSRGLGDEYIVNLNLIDVRRLRTELGLLRKVNGVPALVSEVQSIADRFASPTVTVVPGSAIAEPPPVPKPQPRYRTAAWICTIGGGVVAAAGVALGVAARKKGDDLSAKASTAMPPVFDDQLRKIETDGKALDNAARLFIGAGILAGITGGVLFYVGRPVAVTTDGRSVALVGTF